MTTDTEEYIVWCDDPKHGRYIHGSQDNGHTWQEVIEALAADAYDDPVVQVVRICVAEGTARDVTEDAANEALDQFERDNCWGSTPRVPEFIKNNANVSTARWESIEGDSRW